jgi:hypothetical protein
MNIARTQQSNDASCRKWASIKRIWYYFHVRYQDESSPRHPDTLGGR